MANATTFDSLVQNGLMPKPMAQEIIQKVTQDSVVRKLAGTTPMPITGSTIAVQTGQPQAGIVGAGQQKPVSNMTVATKTVKPIKAAVIVYWDKESRMANPAGYIDVLQEQAAGALTRAFDLAILHGKDALSGQEISGVDFVNKTTKRVELGTAKKDAGGVGADLLAGYDLVVNDADHLWNFDGFAADDTLRTRLMMQTDTLGRPLYTNNLTDAMGTIHGLPTAYGRSVGGKIGAAPDSKVRAFGGDWSQLKYGFAEDITFRTTDTATIVDGSETVNLWQRNMEAFLVEAIFGWVITDASAFVAYDDKVAG
jgi:Phage capsid family.